MRWVAACAPPAAVVGCFPSAGSGRGFRWVRPAISAPRAVAAVAFSPRAAQPCAHSLRAPTHPPRQDATNTPRFAQNNWQMPRIHTIKSNTREKIGGNRAQSARGAYICRTINVSCPLRTHNYLNPRRSGCVRLNHCRPHSNTDFRAVAQRSRPIPARPRLAIGTPPPGHAKKPTNGV